MPLLHQESYANAQIGYWAIGEPVSHLIPLVLSEERHFAAQLRAERARREYLASRALLREVAQSQGMVYQGVRKDEFGRPWLRGFEDLFISVSHTHALCAVILSERQPVGIDIETAHPRLVRVVPRVFSRDELDWADSLPKKCLGWCAKETLYKWHGERKLTFREDLRFETTHTNRMERGWVAGREVQLQVRHFGTTKLVFGL